MHLNVGAVVDRFQIESVIGEGGMAIVYKVTHRELGTTHAMKVLQLSSQSVQERMLREGRIQATLDHENVVNVSDVIRVHGVPALVMEYVPGPPLDHLLFRLKPSFAQIDDIVQGILRGVIHAHERKMIHRDLKLANILMLVKDDRVIPKITDFGLAKLLDNHGSLGGGTQSGVAMGTPTFMAPEQYRNAKHVDHRADVFSIGAMAYQLVTGKPAYSGDDLIELHRMSSEEKYLAIPEARPDVPPRFERAIEGALRAHLDQRIQSASDLLEVWRGEDLGPWVSLHRSPDKPLWPEHTREVIRHLAPERKPREVLFSKPTLTPVSTERSSMPPLAAVPPPPRAPVVIGAGLALLGVVIIALIALSVGVIVGLSGQMAEAPPMSQVAPGTAPTIVAEPAIEPTPSKPAPDPRPSATRVPSPAPAERTATASVRIQGVESAYLQGRGGVRVEAGGTVPPGTYTVFAFFDPTTPTQVLDVTVAPGEELVLSCVPGMRICK